MDAAYESLQHLVPHLEREVGPSLVPLLLAGGDESLIDGSGTLLKIAGEAFLVTASHVAKECSDRGFVVPSPGTRTLLHLVGDGVLAIDDDRHDVAVLRLEPVVASRLASAGYLFLSTWHIETIAAPRARPGRYLILGYPRTATRREGTTVTYEPEGFACRLAEPSARGSLPSSYNPDLHLLFPKPRSARNIRTDLDESVPNPKGMSGGSVWWLGEETEAGPPEERIGNVRWIGVQSSVYWGSRDDDPDLLKVVGLGAVADLIERKWPDLGPALSLHKFARVPGNV